MIVRTGLASVVVNFGDATFHMSELSTRQEADIAVKAASFPGLALKMKFVAAVKKWYQIHGNDGPLECDDKNKGIVFDSNQDLAEHVLQAYLKAIMAKKEEEKKILQSGQSGTLILNNPKPAKPVAA